MSPVLPACSLVEECFGVALASGLTALCAQSQERHGKNPHSMQDPDDDAAGTYLGANGIVWHCVDTDMLVPFQQMTWVMQ